MSQIFTLPASLASGKDRKHKQLKKNQIELVKLCILPLLAKVIRFKPFYGNVGESLLWKFVPRLIMIIHE